VTALNKATPKTVDLVWVKGHTGTPENERADELACKAVERTGTMSLSYIKLRISERFRKAKDTWHADPRPHGTEEIPPGPQEVHAR
jgi:ribonuclease HI